MEHIMTIETVSCSCGGLHIPEYEDICNCNLHRYRCPVCWDTIMG